MIDDKFKELSKEQKVLLEEVVNTCMENDGAFAVKHDKCYLMRDLLFEGYVQEKNPCPYRVDNYFCCYNELHKRYDQDMSDGKLYIVLLLHIMKVIMIVEVNIIELDKQNKTISWIQATD